MKKTAANVSSQRQTTTDKGVPQPALTSVKQLRVGQALFETTWRIAVPVVILTGLGIFVDLHAGTKPWLTLLGAIIGFVFAGYLINRLLKESE